MADRHQHWPKAVRTIEIGRHFVAPVCRVAVSDSGCDRGAIVDIFAFRVADIANVSVLDAVPHLEIVLHITVIFGIGVHETGFLYRFDKRNSLRYRSTGKHFGQNMFACVKTFNCVQSMFMCIIGKNHGIHIMSDKIIKIGVGCHVCIFFFCHL